VHAPFLLQYRVQLMPAISVSPAAPSLGNDDLKKSLKFGNDLVELLDQRGWHTIPRSELKLCLLHLASKADVLDISLPRLTLAARLRISPTTLDGLLRDRALLCSNVRAFDFDQFFQWAYSHWQTGETDESPGLIVFSLTNEEQRMQVEGFLEELSIVPNYKINNTLLEFDLKLPVAKLEARNEIPLSDLVSAIVSDQKKSAEILSNFQANPKRELMGLLMSSLKEQAGKHIGDKTVELLIALLQLTWRSASKLNRDTI